MHGTMNVKKKKQELVFSLIWDSRSVDDVDFGLPDSDAMSTRTTFCRILLSSLIDPTTHSYHIKEELILIFSLRI